MGFDYKLVPEGSLSLKKTKLPLTPSVVPKISEYSDAAAHGLSSVVSRAVREWHYTGMALTPIARKT